MLRLLPVFFVGATLAAMAFAPAPLPKVPKKTATIDGTWEVVERHVNGRRDDARVSHPLDDHGGVAAIEMRGRAGFRRVAGFTYRLVKPAGGRAGEIDYVLTPADGDTPPSAFRGRFELDGDTLKVCRSHSPEQDRPAGCEPSAGTDLYVLKRANGAKKDE